MPTYLGPDGQRIPAVPVVVITDEGVKAGELVGNEIRVDPSTPLLQLPPWPAIEPHPDDELF